MFSLGVAAIAFLSMLIPNWKIIAALFLLFPAILIVAFTLWIVEETPSFSLRSGKPNLLKSLNKIARINRQEPLLYE